MGVALVLLAVLCYGINGNLIVPLQQRYGGPALTVWALTVSSAALLPIGIAGLGDSEFVWSSVVAVLILGVVGTGIARSLAATLAGRAGAPRMSTTTYLLPVIAMVLGAVWGDGGAGGSLDCHPGGAVGGLGSRHAGDGVGPGGILGGSPAAGHARRVDPRSHSGRLLSRMRRTE